MRFDITVKEKGREKPVTSTWLGQATIPFLISFYGLHEPDVEWYKIREVKTRLWNL